MKIQNKLMLCLTLFSLLTLTSCLNFCKPIERPEDLEAIDWKNYNDVKTVYWNLFDKCENIDYNQTGDTIMVYGWIVTPRYENIKAYGFALSDKTENTTDHRYSRVIGVQCFDTYVIDRIQSIFDTTDLMKKCYVKGTLEFNDMPTNTCCTADPIIIIHDAEDIYFEK